MNIECPDIGNSIPKASHKKRLDLWQQITQWLEPKVVSKTSYGVMSNMEWLEKVNEGLVTKYGPQTQSKIREEHGRYAIFAVIPLVTNYK
jgi:hypothetical protein